MFTKQKASQHEIASLVGTTTIVTGDIEFTGGLRIDGTVRGCVRCDGEKGGMLVISESGRVEGEVRAGHLVVAGRITGPVIASQLVELQPKARIQGDVRYRAIEMHHGAVVEGTMIHLSADGKSETRLEPVIEAKPNLKLAANGNSGS
jgi:cytoskeletal protein CcmA (bactofilin family)